MNNIRRELFKIFQNTKNQYDLYEDVIKYINSVIENTKGKENSEFYNVLRELSNSINNAGCESRRSQQISLINKSMNDISNNYEDYLY